MPEVCGLAVSECEEFFSGLELDATGQIIAAEAVKEIRGRLQFLKNVGLEYLTLDRTAPTLSGGEMQRIRLAGQIGCGLVGVLYVLDEPSVGLHPRDNNRLLDTLGRLRDQGNTVIVVEHDEDTMRAADYVVDFGPGPGVRGGHVVAAGPVERICAEPKSLTGQYLSGQRRIEIPARRRPVGDARLVVRGATHNNLKGIDVEIPLGVFVCVTGVSGSGKSSLVADILVEALGRDLNGGLGNPGAHRGIDGLEHLDRMIAIDQSPIGRTPRSNPATYIKVFDEIRRLYAQLPESKARGYKAGRFSFNVRGGRCEACEGNGSTRLEMDFLADVWVTCPVCEGRRFNRETLQVRFKGQSIAQVLEMDVQEGLRHFENVPAIRQKLQTLHDVGLDYMKLGQPSPTLSGGEAQRVNSPANWSSGAPAGRSTCSTSRPRACTSPTFNCCCGCCTASWTPATPCSWSSTTPRSSRRPTGSSTWAGRGRGGRIRRRRRHAGGSLQSRDQRTREAGSATTGCGFTVSHPTPAKCCGECCTTLAPRPSPPVPRPSPLSPLPSPNPSASAAPGSTTSRASTWTSPATG